MGGIGPAGSVGGAEQQFALKWNDFHTSIISSFRHLRDEEDFIDVTIACDGCSFMAHKVVLSACSPYFRSLLKANPCQHPIVILQDVREQDMEALLRFMYNGEVHIGQEQLPDFLKTAQTLQVRGLADVSTKDQHKLSNMNASIPWSSNGEDSQSMYNSKHSLSVDNAPPSKKLRSSESQNSRFSESPAENRDNSTSENDGKAASMMDVALPQPNSEGNHLNSNQAKTTSEPSSQMHSSNEDSDSYDDEASDAEATDNGHTSITDLTHPKLEAPDFAMSDRSRTDSLMNQSALFDSQRQRGGYPPIPFNLQDIAGLIPGLSGMHNNSQDSYGGGVGGSSSGSSISISGIGSGGGGGGGGVGGGGGCYPGMSLTEPKPVCKECGRVYSSISNLKQHVTNVHSTSIQWEPCPICGKHFKTRQYLFNHLLQTHGMMRRSSEAGKVRATDPRPCPKCNKIYRSAHTLRTHLEDKHTVCPGYRCVLCGTVAKSRNSLHSHMSRQHRGISTKDLPVVPMPSPFDPELASQLYKKAGIKMSAAELRARASPTGAITPIRRSDQRMDNMQSSDNNSCSGDEDPQDLSMNSSNRYNAHHGSSPIDFHHSSMMNNKLNSIGSLLINTLLPSLSNMDKENVDST